MQTIICFLLSLMYRLTMLVISLIVFAGGCLIYPASPVADLEVPVVMYHLGNHVPDVITRMEEAAIAVGAEYRITAPYSEACSQPGDCSGVYDGYMAFHIEHNKLPEFWEAFCEGNAGDIGDILCGLP